MCQVGMLTELAAGVGVAEGVGVGDGGLLGVGLGDGLDAPTPPQPATATASTAVAAAMVIANFWRRSNAVEKIRNVTRRVATTGSFMEVAFPQQTTVRGERANPSLRMALTPGEDFQRRCCLEEMQQLWPEMLPAGRVT